MASYLKRILQRLRSFTSRPPDIPVRTQKKEDGGVIDPPRSPIPGTQVVEPPDPPTTSGKIIKPVHPLIPGDPLSNKPWMKLVEECIELFDELDRHSADFDPPRQELAGFVCSRLEEILERTGVDLISSDSTFDESRHRPERAVSRVAPGAAIAETLSPGFVVGPRVLRRARVRLADEAQA